jgi:Ca-activated chloride channel homolog
LPASLPPPPAQLTLPFASTYNRAVPKVFRNVLWVCLASALIFFAGIRSASSQSPAAPPPTGAAATQTTPPSDVPQNPSAPTNPPSPVKQTPVISITTGAVHLVATVADRHHNLITDLEQSDFKVYEDDQPQKISFFGRETNLPLRIAVLLDTSNSIRPRLKFEQEAAIDFLSSVIRRGKDEAFLMTFDNEPEVIQDYTDNVDTLSRAIESQRAGGGTALRDAIYGATAKLVKAPLPPPPELQIRRVMVVISDGDDNLSDRSKSETLEAVERGEVAIYSISTSTDWLAVDTDQPKKYLKTPGDQVLEEFAELSGGRVFFPYKLDDLEESFQDIGAELRSQYFVAYAPSNPDFNGRFRKIRVEVDRKGLTVRTRKGYFAVAPGSSPGPAGQ